MKLLLLNQRNTEKFLRNTLSFLIPLFILYLTTVISVISQNGHLISLSDFIPTQLAIGGFTLYVLNALLDFLMKVKEQLRS